MPTVLGRIVLAQEGRFKLVTRDGQYKLFVLAHSAPQEPEDLTSIVGSGEVVVEYSPLPNKIAGLASRIKRATR